MKPLPQISNLVGLMAHFNNEEKCKDYLKALIWKGENPSQCPRCGHTKVYQFKNGTTHKCADCRKQFNLYTRTIFENTKLPLQKWIIAIYLACTEKRGTSSYQLAQYLGITQKASYFVLQRVRKLFEALQPTALENIVTADETYIGGKEKNKHWDKKTPGQQGRGGIKTKVAGVMQIGGMVKSTLVQSVGQDVLVPNITKIVKPGSTILTDEWHGYNGLNQTYDHQLCNHQQKQYVSDTGATTNPLENYWSHLKRTVNGTYYHISKKHTQRYLFEFDYKFNYRHLTNGDRFNLTLSQLPNTRLKYRDLIQ